MTGRPISALCLFIGLVLRPKRRDVAQTAYPHAAWLLVFAEPSLAAAEMIMCICAFGDQRRCGDHAAPYDGAGGWQRSILLFPPTRLARKFFLRHFPHHGRLCCSGACMSLMTTLPFERRSNVF